MHPLDSSESMMKNRVTTLASVIVPTYNRAELLLDTLNSVYFQTYRPIELLIINDGSADKTEELVFLWKRKCESDDFKVHYHYQPNRGAPVARNYGMNLSKGYYIQFLDSDDLLHPQKIDLQIRLLISQKSDVAICDFQYITTDGLIIKSMTNSGNLYYKISKGKSIFCAAPLFSATLFSKGLHWNPELLRNQDVDFNFKAMMLSQNYTYTPGYWCFYRKHNRPQISDIYTTTPPEFKKRIKSLSLFGVKYADIIPKKNFIFLSLAILSLTRQYLIFSISQAKN